MRLNSQEILDYLLDNYPGLEDGETEVCGSDLVADLTKLLEIRDDKP